MRTESSGGRLPANDAHLVQLVRGALGKAQRFSLQRINVSSCGFVVTLHGVVTDSEARNGIETTVRKVNGVVDVVNKLGVQEDDRVTSVSPS